MPEMARPHLQIRLAVRKIRRAMEVLQEAQQLSTLDKRASGTAIISAGTDTLIIRRSTSKESASVEMAAEVCWPYTVTINWELFYNIAMSGRGELISLAVEFNEDNKPILTIDSTHLSNVIVNNQIDLVLTSGDYSQTSTATQDNETALAERIQEIDKINEAAGVDSITRQVELYERDPVLSSLIKKMRGARCQICGYSFEMTNGGHYVECHHLEHLSQQGLDCSKNILVLCANHHRQFHYGYVKIIEHTNDWISIEIDGESHRCSLAPRH